MRVRIQRVLISLLALSASIRAQAPDPNPGHAQARQLIEARLPQEKYRSHSRAVEAIMRELATPGKDNMDHWALAGLLHDIDIAETANDLARHGIVGAQILRDASFPGPVVHAVEAHDDRAGVARTSRLDHAVYCADQIYWLVSATGRPIPSGQLNAAKPEALWEQARQVTSKQPILGKLTMECAAIGRTLPQAIAAVQAASRKLQPDVGNDASPPERPRSALPPEPQPH